MSARNILLFICKLLISRKNVYCLFKREAIRKKILKLYSLYIIQKTEKRHYKQFWVRPIFTEERRLMQGASDNLVREMEILDPEKFLIISECHILLLRNFSTLLNHSLLRYTLFEHQYLHALVCK
ncbi:hypothetical protein ALC60_07094 [Trachymyrmex zeteki]|uniref:Uncharacterized protein n=1 Tax=Mycetomoellerius zeteki TaxID=64791 RepID=A0A151X1A6_9HYME|nr:hypothetical protein ALC60_07094 [Trachymyrmex zeteki]